MTQQLLQFLSGELYHNHHYNILRFQSSHSSDSKFMSCFTGPFVLVFVYFLQNVTMLGYKLQETSASVT